MQECSSITVYAWEHTDKKSLVNSRFHFMAFCVSSAVLPLIPSHFCHCHCCQMESICLKCLHGWLLIVPEVPNARRPFLRPTPPTPPSESLCWTGALTWSAHPQWVSLRKPCTLFTLSLSYWRCPTLNLPGELLFHQISHRSHRLCARSCDSVITALMS